MNDGIVTVRGVSTNECPTSLISSFSDTVVELVERASFVKDITPIFEKGSELPARLVDAFEVIAIEKIRTRNVIDDHIHSRRAPEVEIDPDA